MNLEKVREDLFFCLDQFPQSGLKNLLQNRNNLIRSQYSNNYGRGCLFYFLSEGRIHSRETLTHYFTGGSGFPYCEMELYQPARWLVRLIDDQCCHQVCARYGQDPHITYEQLLEWVEDYYNQYCQLGSPSFQQRPQPSLVTAS